MNSFYKLVSCNYGYYDMAWTHLWLIYKLPYKWVHSCYCYYYYYYIIIIIIIIYSYSYVMRFWPQIVAFYFLQFINVWISVMMVLFHNTECGNQKVINERVGYYYYYYYYQFSFRLRLHWLSLCGCHVMNERLENPKTRNRWTTGLIPVQNL